MGLWTDKPSRRVLIAIGSIIALLVVVALYSRTEPDTAYVYGDAESRAMKTIRKHVRQAWDLPKDSVSLIPYWRATAD